MEEKKSRNYLYGRYCEEDTGFPFNPNRKDIILYLDFSEVKRSLPFIEGVFYTRTSLERHLRGNTHIPKGEISDFEEKYHGKFVLLRQVELAKPVKTEEKTTRIKALKSIIARKGNRKEDKD